MLGLALQTEGAGITDVSDALLHLEPLCAGLCAEREDRSSTVVPALEAVHREAVEAIDGDEQRFTVAASRFHEALVANCGSHSLIWVVGALETIWSAHAERRAHERTEAVPAAERRAGVDAHARIIGLIAAGDSRGTAALVRRHLEYGQRVPLSGHQESPVTAALIREPRVAPALSRPPAPRPAHRR
jgi:DNA-binding GntR family transcriptional regulator